jgi:hypothetical protein
MIDLKGFTNLRLLGGFVIVEIEFTTEPFTDALGRDAVAQTRIVGKELRLLIRSDLPDEELSITLYHEVLEAVSVASIHPPASVMDFNEADFEGAARVAHEQWGNASPQSLSRLLRFYEFRED